MPPPGWRLYREEEVERWKRDSQLLDEFRMRMLDGEEGRRGQGGGFVGAAARSQATEAGTGSGPKRRPRRGPGRAERRAGDRAMVSSALLEHHRFSEAENSAELNLEPLTQAELGKKLRWGQYKVSRVLERCFPAGFWDRYKTACKGEALMGLLTKLEDGSMEATGVYGRPMQPTEREERTAAKYQ
jgi:hypothetical protein